ncbi:MAG: SDR family NAD(P)-dependent oxidoreductase, partial [Pseudomonadota bacterium]
GLVGNAAMLGTIGPLAHQGFDDWARVIRVNLLANIALLQAFDPPLRRHRGRLVFVTSGVAQMAKPYWSAYAASKAALEAAVRAYAGEHRKSGMAVNLLDPGIMRTRMRAEAFPGEDPNQLAAPEQLVPTVLQMLDPAFERNGEIIRINQRKR